MENSPMNVEGTVLYQIETGVPVPTDVRGKGITSTLKRLRVGESVVLPTNCVSTQLALLQRNGYGKFTARKLGDKRMRVWKIPDSNT